MPPYAFFQNVAVYLKCVTMVSILIGQKQVKCVEHLN